MIAFSMTDLFLYILLNLNRCLVVLWKAEERGAVNHIHRLHH